MATHLAEIFCTEKDKVNCPFYWKIGACRHGEKCIRVHNKPMISQTIIIPHMYLKPLTPEGQPLPDRPDTHDLLRTHFEEFFEDVFEELSKYGEIDDLNVCDNTADHLIGNVYVKYRRDDEAQRCIESLRGRFFAGRPLAPEFSPVTDFKDACCRQDERSECRYGGLCNFLHIKRIDRSLFRSLMREQRERWSQINRDRRRMETESGGGSGGDRERERERDRQRSRSPDRHRGGDERYPRDERSSSSREDRYRDDRYRDERYSRDERPRDDRRDDRYRDDRHPRDDRPRDDRSAPSRDDRPRGGDDRSREDRYRDDRYRGDERYPRDDRSRSREAEQMIPPPMEGGDMRYPPPPPSHSQQVPPQIYPEEYQDRRYPPEHNPSQF